MATKPLPNEGSRPALCALCLRAPATGYLSAQCWKAVSCCASCKAVAGVAHRADAMHPLMALAHPIVLARGPEELADEFEERAAIRTWQGDVDTFEGELGAAREVMARYIERNKEWLPCS